MERVWRALGEECVLRFCVLEPGESVRAAAAAVEAHLTAAALAVPVGTKFSECVNKLRTAAKAGSNASVYCLGPSAWVPIEPLYVSYACREDDAFHFKIVKAPSVVDNSQEWARTVLRPFPFSVVELEGLRKAMEEPLPLPIPVADTVYATLDPQVAPMFIPSSLYHADRIASRITSFMISSPTTPGALENLQQSVWDQAFALLWMDLLPLLEVVSIHFNRNVVDRSGPIYSLLPKEPETLYAYIEENALRPDLMLWALSRLCVKFEEKRETLQQALEDLCAKLCVLPVEYFGPVQWIIGTALAQGEMAVWAMRQGQQPDSLTGILNMRSQVDRATCLRLSINFLRVALSLTSVFRTLPYLPRPFTELHPCRYGAAEQITRKLRISYPTVVKTVHPWSQHELEGFSTADYVSRAYKTHHAALVRAENLWWRLDRYKVVLGPVGFEQLVSDENELRRAVHDVVEGLEALHSAGLVHRDVRWKNVLNTRNGHWMLIDMETVWESGHEPKCWLRAWDENTLVDGKYTAQSDLYLVGKLMRTLHVLSPEAKAFQSKLLNHEFGSAREVLEAEFLKGATGV